MNRLCGNPARRCQEFSCGKEVRGGMGGGAVQWWWWWCKAGPRLSATISCDYIFFDGVYPVGSAQAENWMWGQDEPVFLFFPQWRFFLIISKIRKQR